MCAHRVALQLRGPLDRQSIVADFDSEHRTDLVNAQQHRLEWRGGRRLAGTALTRSPYLGRTLQAEARPCQNSCCTILVFQNRRKQINLSNMMCGVEEVA